MTDNDYHTTNYIYLTIARKKQKLTNLGLTEDNLAVATRFHYAQTQRARCKHGNSCFSDLAIQVSKVNGTHQSFIETEQSRFRVLPERAREDLGTRLATETVHFTVHL